MDRTVKNEKWTDPKLLEDYLKSKKEPGIYIIGSSKKKGIDPTPSNVDDPYLLGNFPNNFTPIYVGISESIKTGIKGRLSKHARQKGNKHIVQLIDLQVDLYFICIYGDELVTCYEPLFTALKGVGQFEGNFRLEHERNHRKRHEKIHERLTGQKFDPPPYWDCASDGM
jgi:hypothetical protein